jgi:hypothetical protein
VIVGINAAFAVSEFVKGAFRVTDEAFCTAVTNRISFMYETADPTDNPCGAAVCIPFVPAVDATTRPLLVCGTPPSAA